MMNNRDVLRQKPQEAIDEVKEEPKLTPAEKETIIHFAKCDDYALIESHEAGITRRLLDHPKFGATVLHGNTADAWGVSLSPDAYSGETVTGVKGYLPIGALKVSARSRSTAGHASVVSKDAAAVRVEDDG